MSDLISRKALLEAFKTHGRFNHTEQVFDLITNAPAIEQGEPVAWMIWWDDREWLFTGDREDFDDATKYNFPITPLYTTPPQPKTVKDALEKAAEIVRSASNTLNGANAETVLVAIANDIDALIED